MKPPRAVFVLLQALPGSLPAQSGPDLGRVLARSAFGEVRAAEFYREVACRHGQDPQWRSMLDELIDVEIVALEMTAAGLEVTSEEVERRLEAERRKAREQGKSLEQLLSETGGLDLDAIRRYAAVALAQERLAAAALGVEPSQVNQAQIALWLQEIRTKYQPRIELFLDRLDAGTAARVAGRPVSAEIFGWALSAALQRSQKTLLEQVVNSLVSGRRIRVLAREAGLEITAEDEERELERRRANILADPRFRGLLTLDKLLADRGSSVESLKRSRSFQDFILLDKLVGRQHPPQALAAHLEANRADYLDRFGESRHLWHIALPITPDRAKESLEEARSVRDRIQGPASFRWFAMRYSTDPETRKTGGDLGLVHRAEPGLPQPLLEAAFRLEPGEVGGPIEAQGRQHLLMVTEVRPCPPDEALLGHVREDLRVAFLRGILAEARIEIAGRP